MHTGFIFSLLTLFLYGMVLFLMGFFPASYQGTETTPKNGSIPTTLDNFEIEPPAKKYVQTILMVIDALRYDFPTPTTMPFTRSKECGFLKIRVDTPTVTMPRLKSLTTGTVSNFVDIILNIGHTEELDDSLLHRMRQRGDAIIFAGDRTWTNLFPSEFTRQYPNIDSFFVNDFYQGDKNVTKIVEDEMEQTDWDFLILHYLGLDHIGHVEGSESLKIPPKLLEMDSAIQKIYNADSLIGELLIITGDHGMRNGGGHGGSTAEELYVPLIFLNDKCTQKSPSSSATTNEYNQIDVAPTLAILLNIEIPTASIGCLIPELLESLSLEEQLYAYYYNTLHLFEKASKKLGLEHVKETVYFKWFNDAKVSHKQFLASKRNDNFTSTFSFTNAKMNYMSTSRTISDELSSSLVRFDYNLITIGLSLTTLIALYLLFTFLTSATTTTVVLAASSIHRFSYKQILFALSTTILIMVFRDNIRNGIYMLPLTACVLLLEGIAMLLVRHFQTSRNYNSTYMELLPLPLTCSYILYIFSLGSSSFIEREFYSWYYLGSSLLMWIVLKNFYAHFQNYANQFTLHEVFKMRSSIIMLIIIGLLRRIDEYVLYTAKNKHWLSLLFGLGLLLLLIVVRKNLKRTQLMACIVAALSVYGFRGINGVVTYFTFTFCNTGLMLVIFWISIEVIFVLQYKLIWSKIEDSKIEVNCTDLLRTNMVCLGFILALFHKPHNVILLPALIFVLDETYKLCDNFQMSNHWSGSKEQHQQCALLSKVTMTLFIANMFYFYQGNSNSLATIDLNPGYIGQSSYNPIIVAIFVTLNTYGAHIYSFVYLIVHILSETEEQNGQSVSQEQPQKQNTVITTERKEQNLQLVFFFYTITTILPVAIYLWILLSFRYHLFIYSVFAPKSLYACYSIVVFFFFFSLTYFFLKIIKKQNISL